MTRRDPLAYLASELESLKQQGLYRQLRILDGEQSHTTTFDHRAGRQSLVEQLSRADDASEAARSGARGDPSGSASAPARCAPSPARWTSTWSSNAGWRRSRRPKRSSCSRAASPRTPARSPPSSPRTTSSISDELNHASIIDGCRLSRATIKVFPHKDVDAARKILRGAAGRPAQAAHHRRRLQHGRRPRRAAGAVRARRGIRLHHDGRRCACERRVRDERARHDRPLRHARARRHPGRHAVEGDRRARRLRRRQPGADRVPVSPRAAVPVLDVASAGGRRRVHRGDRRPRAGAGADRAAVGEHALLQGRPERSSASTPGSARARSRRSSSATARWR